jgi:uncharacterized protein involved in outer membrane biogenesis
MKVFKLLLVLIVFVLVVAVGVLLYLVNNINGIVKDVVESEGPKVTQTDVTLGGVDIQLRKGRGELSDLVIANPPGFDSAEAFHADQLVLQIKPSSLVGDVIIIEEIVVKGVNVTAEQKGLTTNLQTLLKSVQESAGGEQEPASGESDIRLMVEKLSFADSSLKLITEDYGSYPVDLPGLELTNLGSPENGLTPAQLGEAILEPALRQAAKVAQERLKDEAQDKAEEKLKEKAREELGDDAEEKVNKLRGLLD